MRVPHVRAFGFGICVLSIGGMMCASRALAQGSTNRFAVGLEGGAYKLFGGNLDHSTIGPLGSLSLRLPWKAHFGIETGLRYGYDWDDSKTFRDRNFTFAADVLYSHTPEKRWTPQGFLGAGANWWTVHDFRGKSSPGPFATGRIASGFKDDSHPSLLQGSNFDFFAGAGVALGLMANVSLRAGARLDYLQGQHIDNTGASDSLGSSGDATGAALRRAIGNVDANQLMPSFYVGLTYAFGSGAMAEAPETPAPPPAAPETAPLTEPAPQTPADSTQAPEPGQPPQPDQPTPKPEAGASAASGDAAGAQAAAPSQPASEPSAATPEPGAAEPAQPAKPQSDAATPRP